MPKQSEHIERPIGPVGNLEIPLTLTEDGRYFVKYGEKILAEGTYTISGDKIILTDDWRERCSHRSGTATGEYHGIKYCM
jgi:hypothetical protein